MNKEEKKALETVKEELQDQKEAFKYYRGVLGLYSNGKVETVLNLVEKQQNEIKHQRKQRKYWRDNFYEQEKLLNDLRTEHKIMKRMIKENGLWETLLNDNEFIKYLNEEK